jgi:lysophospholipase L1-like esterase
MGTKPVWLALTAACISVLIGLALCELVARLLAPPWLQQRMAALNSTNVGSGAFGSDRDWKVERRDGRFLSFTPRQRLEVAHIEYRNVANIDESGGRRTFSAAKPGSPTIVLFGDSFTFGVGVEDVETFASRIATGFPQYRLINLGVPGSALVQQLEILKARHEELRPETYLFFFFLGNDFADILQHSDLVDQKFRAGFLRAVNAHACHQELLEHSYAMQLVCSALPLTAIATRPWFEFPRDPVFYVMDRSMARYQQMAAAALAHELKALADIQRTLNFKCLIIAIPDVHQISDAARKRRAELYRVPFQGLEPLRPNAILSKETQEAGLPLYDPTACIAASVQEPETLYYKHDNHFRRLGHEVLADCVRAEIAKLISSEAPQ